MRPSHAISGMLGIDELHIHRRVQAGGALPLYHQKRRQVSMDRKKIGPSSSRITPQSCRNVLFTTISRSSLNTFSLFHLVVRGFIRCLMTAE